MIFPANSTSTLILLIFSMFCFAAWSNTQKAAKKWRFELYYLDFGLGMLLCSIALALTFGSMGTELSVEDNLVIAGKRNMAYAFAAGGVFSLANMMLAGAVSVAGISVAFPIAFATTMILGIPISMFFGVAGSAVYRGIGGAFLACSILSIALAHSEHTETVRERLAALGKKKRDAAGKGIFLSAISGLLMSMFFPLVDLCKAGEIGLGPYSVGIFAALGAFLMIFPLNLYFMNLPVSGESIGFLAYTKGSAKQHLLGLLGGIIGYAGLLGLLIAYSVPKQNFPNAAQVFGLAHGAPLLSMLFGTLIWKEFSAPTGRTPLLLAGGGLLFAAGLGCLAIA